MSTLSSLFFFFNDTATTEIYTLSLHDALPISACIWRIPAAHSACRPARTWWRGRHRGCRSGSRENRDVGDRKSTRLNSSHQIISYAVFCLKKKKRQTHHPALRETCRGRTTGSS